MMNQTKNETLEWGMILLFLLPPLGMVWMIGIGLYHICNKLLHKQTIEALHPTSFFFLTLFFSSLGACLHLREGLYFFIPAMVLGYFGLYLYVKEGDTARKLKNFSRITVLGGLYIATIGQLQLQKGYVYGGSWWLGMLTGLMPLGLEEKHRLFGSAYNPNFASFLLLLALACLISGILQTIKARKNWIKPVLLYIILLFPITLAINQTGSRVGVAITMLLFFLLVWKLCWQAGGLLMAITSAYLVYTGSFSAIIPRFESIVQSFETRQVIWKNSIQVWNNSPLFGVTPLGFKEAYAVFEKTGIAHAHNIVLGFFCEYGIIGGTSFLLLIITSLHKVVQAFFLSRQHDAKSELFFFVLPVLLLTGVLDHPLISPQTALLAIILLGSWDRYTDHILAPSASFSSTKNLQSD
ncbi:O-antigen ligase family protein [Aneurinibacillus thermoaerophilus]|uniref:O-antigen ligase n=1 Tax=Aneurinibacillus thermoaerophilus TaxID=143495 RepID=A0A1G8ATJ7_ANETH|nr:O-antigen ligase family protein [Aneurinibacillus thermoaerophilus]MED0677046.1 O-antigen ligase family protein [Aneurinibacillus thermoaerophilus]MED0680064.1 O-antigen ligase family protein [Aneurinibacillus thermoaerophilus]MED0738178.1 O-antigen ligase family protein [Aneurinibacillus thermoaerophilus]MED0763442.1 O-antigen ligase family protein [Aneurinibacillus thermoaerophilus]SDH24174.1 O-antigen ligase [Aneurinibacillus thermoaerophilus]